MNRNRITRSGDYGHSKFDITNGTFETPILREGRLYHQGMGGVIDLFDYTIGKSDGVSHALLVVTIDCAIFSAAICHRMSATLFSTEGWVTLGQILRCSLWSSLYP